MSEVNPDAAAMSAAQARNVTLSRALMEVLQGAEPIEQVAALITAATAVIEVQFAPADRLTVLNAMLGDTIRTWAPAPTEARII